MEETHQQYPLEPPTPVKRPVLLTVLCILTFIGSGMNFFSSMMIAGFYDTFLTIMEEISGKISMPGLDMLAEAKPDFFFVSGIFYAGSVFGAILMMRLKKTGFHVYTICQILLILAPMYFMHLPNPGFLDILFSGTFVILYATTLKYMN